MSFGPQASENRDPLVLVFLGGFLFLVLPHKMAGPK